jgi:cytochrome P450
VRERDAAATADLEDSRAARNPFGGGRRRCIGAAFARMQLRAMLTVAARRVDLRVVDPPDEPMRRRGVVIAPDHAARAFSRR